MTMVARAAAPDAGSRSPILHGELRVDLEAFRVTYLGRHVHLGPIPYRILVFMLGSPGVVHSREDLISAIWPSGTRIRPATVNMHVLRLRTALASRGGADLIVGVRGIGYGLRALPRQTGRPRGRHARPASGEHHGH